MNWQNAEDLIKTAAEKIKTEDDQDQEEKIIPKDFLPLESVYFYGCAHYLRECSVQCPDCERFFPCRVCHDEISDHQLVRQKIAKVFCYRCNKIGKFDDICEHCNNKFSEYFCEICRFFDSRPFTPKFHCEKCKLCRMGLRQNYFHCDTCGCCLSITQQGNHKCLQEATQRNCPVCFENMYTSRESSMPMKCGHFIHVSCYEEMWKNMIYRCPVCQEPLYDVKKKEKKEGEEDEEEGNEEEEGGGLIQQALERIRGLFGQGNNEGEEDEDDIDADEEDDDEEDADEENNQNEEQNGQDNNNQEQNDNNTDANNDEEEQGK
ncbi:MAG: putative E3 ubiquitin-protein ligase MIEL1 [Streblomastix strix]|uniref:Putative E3 ubiquitin-protein ligase MIEL1 n=1 Tax=Streblomastix strix TaxID=222440 RepID=A0A5J4X1Q3_9EUKA|nr:MAG: putative E3 ubiquitin-protein ligase MIEL1 [Streblomastix strix]